MEELEAAITQNLSMINYLFISLEAMEQTLRAKNPDLYKDYAGCRESLRSGEYGRKLGQSIDALQQAFARAHS